MVLFFPVPSRCVLCDKIIEAQDKMQGFPAFLPFDHKYGKFSDAAVHESCYVAHPDHDMVADMLCAYTMIWDTRPRDLKTIEEIDNWYREAFQDWPPKNGVVIFHSFCDNPDGESFYMDADQYEAFCEAEDKANKEMEERYNERHRRDREMMRYDRE